MHLRLLFILALLLAGCSSTKRETAQQSAQVPTAIDPATAATITGTITFSGDAPKPEKIDMSQDPACVIGTEPNFSQSFAVDKGKLQNVYVYIKDGLGNRVFGMTFGPAILEQRGCRYIPHVMGIVVNQKLRIMNDDPALHNIHPAAQVNESWNVSQSPKGEPVEQTFSKPELMIPVKCNQHPWMKMYLNVSPHPFFSVSQKDGTFEIKGLPPGEYTIAAVHERMGEKTQKISIGPKETKAVDFAFTAGDAAK
jgi:hypothetical protein